MIVTKIDWLQPETWIEIFLEVEARDLCSLKGTCEQFRKYIDSSTALQTKLVYEKFLNSYIHSDPAFELRLHRESNSLCIRIQSDLGLLHALTNSPDVLPYVNYFFVNEASEASKTQLITLCQFLNPQKNLFLHKCTLDQDAINALQPLKAKISISDSEIHECSFPEEWINSKPLNFDQFLRENSDQSLLENLSKIVDAEPLFETIRNIITNLSPDVRSKLFHSIWSSSLASPSEPNLSTKAIESRVWTYLSKNCEWTALAAAVENLIKIFSP